MVVSLGRADLAPVLASAAAVDEDARCRPKSEVEDEDEDDEDDDEDDDEAKAAAEGRAARRAKLAPAPLQARPVLAAEITTNIETPSRRSTQRMEYP